MCYSGGRCNLTSGGLQGKNKKWQDVCKCAYNQQNRLIVLVFGKQMISYHWLNMLDLLLLHTSRVFQRERENSGGVKIHLPVKIERSSLPESCTDNQTGIGSGSDTNKHG